MWDLLRYSANTAIIDDCGHSMTYGKLAEETERLATKVNGRCLVFCMCNNSIGSLVGYIGFLNGHIVPAMLKSDLDEEMLERLYRDYEPAYIWTSKESLQKSLFASLTKIYEVYHYCLLRTPFENKTRLYEDLALLLTTSGSTGSPKFVRQSYINIRANTDSIIEYLDLDSSERPITSLPMNYTYGISVLNTHIDVGATILLTDKGLMQREFWNFFKENQATSIAGVPYTYEMLKRLRFMSKDLPSLRTMTQAGGKLLPHLHQEFAEYADKNGKNFVVMYGQCEATARMGYLPPNMTIEKKGSMGIAIPGGQFHLIDINENNIESPYVTGELVYEGANVTLGYAECGNDLAKGDERGGILKTGDMAQFDEDGYYYIVGRKKRFLKIYGNRINLDDCERILKARFNVDVVCGGIDDRMYIFSEDRSSLVEMRQFIAEKTGLNQQAFETKYLEKIPHNESGKTLYKELEKYYN